MIRNTLEQSIHLFNLPFADLDVPPSPVKVNIYCINFQYNSNEHFIAAGRPWTHSPPREGYKKVKFTQLTVCVNYELEKSLLEFGEGVKVIAPKTLVSRIHSRLKHAVSLYDVVQ